MSTDKTWQVESTNLETTLAIAEQIGNRLKGGEVFSLSSDLGGGKTTFVKGLGKGIGSQDIVRSPSFTISNQYSSNNLTLYHYDFYRLSEAGIMRDELAEAITDPNAVVAVEWADIVDDVLPAEHIRVIIHATSETSRLIKFDYPETYSYLFADKI